MTGPATSAGDVAAVPQPPLPLPLPRRRIGSLAGRAVLITCLVALISVVITALVALPLAVRTAKADAQQVLADKARVAAEVIEGRTAAGAAREEQRAQRVATTLRAQGVVVVLIRDGAADSAGLPAGLVRQVTAGQSVRRQILYQGRRYYAAARPAGDRYGIVLLQPVAAIGWRTVLNRLWLALLAGLSAGLVAGLLLTQWLARPIRGAAVAARRLSAGDRGVRAPVAAPAEIADLGHALNDLASALASSENRQRTFLTSISHELRTPLTSIKGYAEALADGVIGPEGAQRAGQTVLEQAEQLDRLVADLLALARLEADDFPLEIMQVDLTALVATAAEAWSGRCAAAGAVLRAELPDHPVPVRADPGRLRQVLDGLMENALRVVPAGAPIVLAVRPGPRYSVMEVRDGGPGLRDDDLAIAFDQGALHQRYQGVRAVGSGLGLALAARLVHRLGGRIEAGHAAEGGARFTTYLPDQATRPGRTR